MDTPAALHTILSDVQRRWTLRARLRAWTRGAAAAATVLGVGSVCWWLVAREGIPLVVTVGLTAITAVLALGYALWTVRRRPSEARIARLIEERTPGLDDVVVTAVAYGARADASPRMREALSADAARALAEIDADATVPSASVRRAAFQAALGTAALAALAALFAPATSRATNVAAAYLFPARLSLEVLPGNVKVRAGQPVTIAVRVDGSAGEVVPELTVAIGDESRTMRMPAAETRGVFAVTIDNVRASFGYQVSAAASRSEAYAVSVVRPPSVERIDLQYAFPKGLGLAPRTDEDSGDIYGPPGTSVRLHVTADKPIRSANLVLDDGTQVPLTASHQSLDGALTIEVDGSYRVALIDEDGLENADDTEYFIRTLDDRPPDVRILRPASDRQVTPLEEVTIEARAVDDYGIAVFELVVQPSAGEERTVPLKGTGGLTASGQHTVFMEDLGVQPGDFVTYYARARDVNRGRRSTEARSDIFFLEVKPFEEEFVAAQSQAMGQGAGQQGDTGLEAFIDAQKEIIVATWKLDARARRARGTGSSQDIKLVGKAQSDLRGKVEQAASQMSRTAGDPRRRRAAPVAPPGDDPLGRAVEAMGRAVNELDQAVTSAALPHEMEALNQLLKAAAEIRRRQVTRSQQAGGGGANRSEADLSSLFDQELRRRQETNYETPNSTEERQETNREDPLDKIRELARRQDALNRQQRELARRGDELADEELKRQLERLTREQNELRQQAEQLARQMQSGQQQPSASPSSKPGGEPSSQSAGGGQDGRRLREVSEEMRNAATGLRRQDAGQAAESGSRASDQLRELERDMRSARPDDRRRALGDLQLETRQLADAQRRLAGEAGKTGQGPAGDDARRRLAGEQDRLAERTDRLQDDVRRMSRARQGEGSDQRATDEAAREFENQKLADRMRQSADALRQSGRRPEGDEGAPAADGAREAARQGQDVARALDRIADKLGAATGEEAAETQRLSDQLARTQELREQVAALERSIEELQREARQAGADARPSSGRDGERSAEPPSASKPGPQRAESSQAGQQTAGAQASAEGRQGSSGQQAGTSGGDGGRLEQLQRDVGERMREAERLAAEMRRESPGQGPNTSQGWWRSVSAPGTEGFKQDFARWESLKKNLLVAIEGVETDVSGELRTRANRERLNAGGHHSVSEAYRDLVDKYYRSLASPRRPQ